jgi:Ca-activated chloride channel family protein
MKFSKSMTTILFCAVSWTTSSQAASPLKDAEGIWRNNDGVRLFKDKRGFEAYGQFVQSLTDLPFEPEIHLNLGLTFLENKEFEKSLQESLTAAHLAGAQKNLPAIQFSGLFNAAVAATELKNIDLALSLYQAALEIKPDSVEAKTNIELLAQQQQGGGQGDSDKKDQSGQQNKKDQQSPNDKPKDDPNKQKQPQDQGQQPKPKPKPYEGKDISKQDVNQILEELKRQEEDVRARFQREGVKNAPKDKDW